MRTIIACGESYGRTGGAGKGAPAKAPSLLPTVVLSSSCRPPTLRTMLAAVDLSNPMLWAVFIGWIMSVVLHEFAHGLVAHLGGDYTIRERGGLTLNPLQYIDPLFSLIIPAIIFLMGGLPLPGGVTYVRKDLLRSRAWQSAVSAAGPLTNFLLFLICAMPFHPHL